MKLRFRLVWPWLFSATIQEADLGQAKVSAESPWPWVARRQAALFRAAKRTGDYP